MIKIMKISTNFIVNIYKIVDFNSYRTATLSNECNVSTNVHCRNLKCRIVVTDKIKK